MKGFFFFFFGECASEYSTVLVFSGIISGIIKLRRSYSMYNILVLYARRTRRTSRERYLVLYHHVPLTAAAAAAAATRTTNWYTLRFRFFEKRNILRRVSG